MGLAASQARLLTITARKADCEFQSMKLSHEKIALSRDMERISDEYQNAMNKTKLVYDYYGSGTSEMALSYNLLMTPSLYNDYYPKLVTDNANKVVLSDKYAFAAKAAGIPVEGYNGTPSSEVRNKFIEALRDRGAISASTAANVESVSYNNAVGLGLTFTATAATQDVTYSKLKEIIKASCMDTTDYGLSIGGFQPASSYPDTSMVPGHDDQGGRFCKLYKYSTAAPTRCGAAVLGVKEEQSPSITLFDLLDDTTQYVVSYGDSTGSTKPIPEAAYAQQQLVGNENSASFLNWLVDQFGAVLGGVKENELALQYAYNQVYDLIYPNEDIQNTATKWNNDGFATSDNEDKSDYSKHNRDQASEKLDMIGQCTDNCFDSDETDSVAYNSLGLIGFAYSGCYHDPCGHHQDTVCSIAINLNTIADVFLTAFVEYAENMQGSYSYEKGDKSGASLWDESNDHIFKIKAPADVNDGSENLIAGFYDALFNRICANGWTQNDNVENIEYMQELLKNGSVYISSINNDGNYYQNSYSTDTYISEVADIEGIAQAEAKYNAAKARIEHKENTIDMKMKNLDTEISSLTTEYDTMKGLISKVIEKSFKRYEA